MVIKSKKWYRLGYLIIFLVIASVTASMISFYPYLMSRYSGMFSINIYEVTYDYGYYEFYSVTTMIILVLSTVTVLAALIVPCFKSLGVEENPVFCLSFELTSVIAFIVCYMLGSEMLIDMVEDTLNGEYYSNFLDLGIDNAISEALILGINGAVWAIFFFMLYWAATCYRGIFSLGLVRYIRERTLVCRFLVWMKDFIYKSYTAINSVDFREPSNKFILKLVTGNFVMLTLICCFWFAGIGALIIYSIVLFFILRKCFLDIKGKYGILLRATNQIGAGNLDVEITENLGMFEPFKDEIQKIQSGFKRAVEDEVKSQSMRTELITNVSHDLKTPLTAIITYVNLLKKEDLTLEEQKSYIQVLDQKSMRLKSLIEDLFELSKVNSRNITLNIDQVDIVNLLKQVRLELEDQISVSSLDFRFQLPEERIVLPLDSEKTYRVFENLLVNIIKYGMPGTRVYVDMQELSDEVVIYMKNVSASEIKVSASDLTERFVRGDQARNTEGSGLGLAIAKSFVELQKGKMEVEVEADLFKVKITWSYTRCQTEPEQDEDGMDIIDKF